jgi:hypothetical protein
MDNIVNQIVKELNIINQIDYKVMYVSKSGLSDIKTNDCTPLLIIKSKGSSTSDYVLNLNTCMPTKNSKNQIMLSDNIKNQIKLLI